MEEITAKLEEYIRKLCEAENDRGVGLVGSLIDTGFLDSVGSMDVIVFVEKTFGVEISQRDLTLYPMNTVNEIATIVGSKKGLC